MCDTHGTAKNKVIPPLSLHGCASSHRHGDFANRRRTPLPRVPRSSRCKPESMCTWKKFITYEVFMECGRQISFSISSWSIASNINIKTTKENVR